MPLTHTTDEPVVEGLAVRWTMTDGKRKVTCWARAAALEKLERNPDLEKAAYLDAFLRHRAAFDEAASAIFDRGLLDGPNVIVRKENV
jgi:hypothetical protein